MTRFTRIQKVAKLATSECCLFDWGCNDCEFTGDWGCMIGRMGELLWKLGIVSDKDYKA